MKRIILSLAFAAAAAFASAETYALTIGINDYPDAKDAEGKVVDNDLKGCVNDANKMKQVFMQKYGVKESNVRTLLDKNANIEKFIAEMKWLVGAAKPGDQVLFVYSGHGAQVEDKSEADGFEEVIVLADMNLIPGDLFGDLAKILTEGGINSTFIFDSCFSGGMSKDVDGKLVVRNKTFGVVKPKSANALIDAALKMKQVQPRMLDNDSQVPAASSLFAFASQEGKPSKDISGLEGIPAHGLFTLLLTSVLEDDSKIAVKSMYGVINGVIEEINKKVKEQGGNLFDQGPNFETTADRASKPLVLTN